MTMPTAPAAGWYADPNGGLGLRYFDGIAWTDFTQPPPSAPYGYPATTAAAQPTGGVRQTARSKFTLITVAICIAYGVIATYSGFALFGILPVLMTVRAFQAKEPLAPIAAVTIIYSIYQLNS